MSRYGKITDVMELTATGRNTSLRIGRASGALIHIGRATVYDLEKVVAYLENLRREQQAAAAE